MSGTRFARTRSNVNAKRRDRIALGELGGTIALLTVLLAGLLALAPAGASAEPLCTDTWTGPVVGEWEIAADWSTGKVPTSTEVACIGSGDTVYVVAGANHAGVLEDLGALAILGGSLELANALEASSIASLTLRNGSLTGAGTLDVSSSLRWESGGTMSGSGTTVLGSSLSGTLEKSTLLEKRTLVNEGTLEFSPGNGAFQMSDGAALQNKGTFNDAETGSGAIEVASGSTSAPSIVNSGTFEKTVSSGNTTVAVKFENKGTVKTREGIGGYFAFMDGGSGASGTWAAADFAGGSFSLVGDTFSGANQVGGGTVTATEALHGTTGQVDVSSGSLSLSSGTTTFAGLTLNGTGLLTGAGTLDVSTGLAWDAGGKMSGSGATVLKSGASATLEKSTLLEKRRLTNEGTIVFSPGNGAFLMSDGAVLKNKGTFNDYETGIGAIEVASGSTSAPLFVNSGTLEKPLAAPTRSSRCHSKTRA